MKLESVTMDMLGSAKVSITATIVDGGGEGRDRGTCSGRNNQIEETTSVTTVSCRARGKLAGGVAVIRVGYDIRVRA
jgi:hypothetical protein